MHIEEYYIFKLESAKRPKQKPEKICQTFIVFQM